MQVFHQKNRKISRWYALYVVPLLLLIWQLAAMISDSNLILPTPFSVLRAFLALAKTDLFWSAALFSLARV
jgi:ABC-type nitrate/sulfonate/bicarbonate transport system permease component